MDVDRGGVGRGLAGLGLGVGEGEAVVARRVQTLRGGAGRCELRAACTLSSELPVSAVGLRPLLQ